MKGDLLARFQTRFFLLITFALWQGLFSVALAQSPEAKGLMIIPVANTSARLRAQMVDVTFESDQPELRARVRVRLWLDSLLDQAQTFEVQLVGSTSDEILQNSIQLWGNEQPLTLTVTENSASPHALVQLSPGRRFELRLEYIQRLGDGPLVAFAYPLVKATAWPIHDGSSRVQLTLPPGVPREAWLAAEPSPTYFDGTTVTWHFDQAAPDVTVQLYFVHPDAWRQIAKPISEVQDPEALLARLDTLLTLTATDPPTGPAFTRFSPVALAYALETIQKMPTRPEPHLALAHLYALHQDRDGMLSLEYAPLVAAEARAAGELGAPAEHVRPLLQQALERLVVHARQAGDWSAALRYLDEMAGLNPDPSGPTAERSELLVNLAKTHLQDGRWIEAARVIKIDRNLWPPWLEAATVQVEMGLKARTITMQIYARSGREEDAMTQLRRAAEALRAVGGAQVSILEAGEPAEFQIILPLSDTASFLTLGRRLARALPSAPEWALLATLLHPEEFHWKRSDGWLRWRISYAETVNLRPPVDVWQAHASQIEREIEHIAAEEPEPAAGLIRELGQASAAAWRALSRNVQIRYVLNLFPLGTANEPQRWLLQMDERRQLMASREGFLPWLVQWIR
jgi:tetratricopeptide (TPR) repeat protein